MFFAVHAARVEEDLNDQEPFVPVFVCRTRERADAVRESLKLDFPLDRFYIEPCDCSHPQ